MAIYYRTQREICEQAEADAERERDVNVCAHCRIDLDEATLIETSAGLDCCGTRCAVALYFNHDEDCQRPECADGAPLTLPPVLCCYGDGPTGGPMAHESCRQKVRNALALQEGARLEASA